MLTRLFLIFGILLALPAELPAWELSAAQERHCARSGELAVAVGESRDTNLPRSHVVNLAKRAYSSPEYLTWATGLIIWVYEHPELGNTDLYAEIVKSCRKEFAQRYEEETKSQMRTDMATICARPLTWALPSP